MRSLTRLDVDGVVGFEPVGLDNLVPLDEFPHLLSGELFRRIHWRSCKREISVGTQSKTLETVWPLCLTSGSLSHSASLHSLVTLLWVVELESLNVMLELKLRKLINVSILKIIYSKFTTGITWLFLLVLITLDYLRSGFGFSKIVDHPFWF